MRRVLAAGTIFLGLLPTLARAGGIQAPNGDWYCDSGYVATAKGCVPAPKDEKAPEKSDGPKTEYGLPPVNDGSRSTDSRSKASSSKQTKSKSATANGKR